MALRPPRAFPNRLEPIPESETTIDNNYYNALDDSWWSTSTGPTAGLHAINDVRLAYFLRILQQHLPAPPIAVGDIGCGGGILSEALARQGYRVTGVDMSESSVRVATRHAADAGLTNVEYLTGSAYELPFADASLDAVVMSDVLEHLHDLRRAVKEVARVLRPGGVFVYDTINRTWLAYFVTILLGQNRYVGVLPPNTHDFRMYITPEEMKLLCEERGMQHAPGPEVRGIVLGFSLLGFLRARFSMWGGGVSVRETRNTRISYMGWAQKVDDVFSEEEDE